MLRENRYGFRKNKYESQSIFLILVSFFGLFFLITMYLWYPSLKTHNFFLESIILIIFMVICMGGMLAAIHPSTCKGLMKFQNNVHEKTQDNGIRFEGHHPDCDHFQDHTFHIRGKKYCPGCTGLFIGAVIAVVGILLYFIEGLPFKDLPSLYGEIFFLVGVLIVFLALFMIVFLNMEKKLKFISNMALVLGSFLILMGMVGVKENLIMELYFILLVIFWIITRISVSESFHESICRDCQKESICIFE